MDVTQLVKRLKQFDGGMVVTVGDSGGWSNIDLVARDGSSVKLLMSDNVVFSDDRPSQATELAPTHNNASPKLPCDKCTPTCVRQSGGWLDKGYSVCPYCSRQLRA